MTNPPASTPPPDEDGKTGKGALRLSITSSDQLASIRTTLSIMRNLIERVEEDLCVLEAAQIEDGDDR